jgi:hypothetical protein
MTTTHHELYYGTTLIAPNGSHTLGGSADAYSTHLLDFDWGKAPKEIREDDRPHVDGKLRRGAAWGGRDFYHAIGIRVNRAVVTDADDVEGARDDAVQALTNLIMGDGGLIAVKQVRHDISGNDITRVIQAEATPVTAPRWARTDWDEGLVGMFSGPDAVIGINWHAPHPWFVDAATTDTAALTLDGTLRNTTINNPSSRRVPVKIAALGTGSGITFTVYNGTSGATTDLVGAGITLAGVTLDASDAIVVDQYVGDLQRLQAYQAADSVFPYLAARPRLWLSPGDNTVKWQVTGGSATGATLVIGFKGWWATP